MSLEEELAGFWTAIRDDYVDGVRAMLANGNAGALLETAGKEGYRAIHFTAAFGSKEGLAILLEFGAQLSSQRNDGWTALHQFASQGRIQEIQMLVDAGADPNVEGEGLWTPLHVLCADGQGEIVKAAHILIDAGADVNKSKGDDLGPLHLVAARGDIALGELLLEKGAKVNAPAGKRHLTSLMIAAGRDHGDFVRLLTHYGSEVAEVDQMEKDAMFHAIEGDALNAAMALVGAGLTPSRKHFQKSEQLRHELVTTFLFFAIQSDLAGKLREAKLPMYIPVFYEAGATDIESMKDASGADLQKLGIENAEHRRAIHRAFGGKRASLAVAAKRLSQRLSLGKRK